MTREFVMLARSNWLRTMLIWAILLPVFTARATDTEPVILVLPAESKTIPQVIRETGRSLSVKDGHRIALVAAQAHAKLTQAPVLERLAELAESYEITNIRSFWVANAISIECSPRLIPLLEQWPDVAVERDLLLELIPISQPVDVDRRRSLDDGVSAALLDIRATEAWELGLTGVNVLLASFDSGVNGAHPGLAPRWRGNYGHPASECWLDLVEPITSIPGDNDGHGTLTMGLQCGMVTGDTVGVAWNAQFITAAVANGGFTITNALQAFEWIVDPDGNPATFEDVPRVLSNSWGFNGGIEICNNVLFDAMDLAEAAGIAVLWSAGNEGPPSGTIRNPPNRADNLVSGFCVGGWDGVIDSVWVSSSRGPTPCSEDSILRIKPELIAPARNVRSTYLGTSFASSNGTSFSAPLAAGTIGLMIEANPMLPPDSLLELLMLSAVDVDLPGLDNSSGYGKLDALMACQAALTGLGWVHGRIQNQSGAGIAAEIDLVNYPHSTHSNSNGDFLLPLPAYLPFGLQVLANGYLPQTMQVNIVPNDTTYVTFSLSSTAQGILTGIIIDCRGVPAVGAYVDVANAPTVISDGNGRFAMTLNPGTYAVACSSGVCGSTDVPDVQIVAGAITDIEIVLPLNPAFQCSPEDPYGYFLCDSNDPTGPALGYVSISPSENGKGIIHNLPDDGHVPLALPFPVRFYNQSYERIFLNSNGIVSFVHLATAFNNLALPYNLTPALFPFWDDFSDNLGGQILSDYDPAHGTFTLEWYEIPYWIAVPPPTDSANFQVVIYDQTVLPTQSGNNVIEFRYGRIPRNDGCTIGIDRAADDGYVRYGFNGAWESYAVPVDEQLAIRIADEQISSGVPSFALEPSTLALSLEPGESLDTSLFIHNLGSAPLAYSATATGPATSSQGQDTVSRAIDYPDYPKGYTPTRVEARDAQLDEWLPDFYGYAWRTSHNDTSVHYEFLDISNGLGTDLGLALDDTTSYPRPLPFEFELYGRAFKKYSVCTNGFISFWSNSKNYVNDRMSYGRDPYYALAPYWTDLNPEASGDIFEYFDAENDRFIVQWNEIRPFNVLIGNNLTFQTILYPDGGIDFVYEHMRSAVTLKTVGIKGGNTGEFLELSYNGMLVDSLMTIRIARPDTSSSSVRILSGHYDVVPPFGVNELRVRIKNNTVTQGLLALPIHIESSDPVASTTELSVAMQGGVAFEPRAVIMAAGDSLRLHWRSHPMNSYVIWSALPNDTAFVPYVSAIADTHLTIAIPSDLARIYAVNLTGAPAPRVSEIVSNTMSPTK